MAALLLMGCLAMVACDKNKKDKSETKAVAVDATESDVWHYFSFTTGAEVGTGTENETDNATWFARNDWDIAIKKYLIRTNSGEATTIGAQGGVYTFAETVAVDKAVVPAGATFETDKAVESSGMGGTTVTVKSTAQVILFKQEADGSLVMPPVYLKAPVYAFRTADGTGIYNVEFLQYQDENKVSGKVEFNFCKEN